jgi:hypothetical protein
MQLAAKVLVQVSAFPMQNSTMSTPLGLEHHQPCIRYVLLFQTVISGGKGRGYHHIRTCDGENTNASGEFNHSAIPSALVSVQVIFLLQASVDEANNSS